jgi:hypothetical protein
MSACKRKRMRRLATGNLIVAPGGMPVIETTIIITLLSQVPFVFCIFFFTVKCNRECCSSPAFSSVGRVVVGRAAGMMQFLQRD